MRKIWLDDDRSAPPGWERTTTVRETIGALLAGGVEVLSLDNDLGEGQPEGYKVTDWIESMVFRNKTWFIPPRIIRVHSGNPVARRRIEVTIDRIHHPPNEA